MSVDQSIVEQAAMGRIGYALRALTNGWRVLQEAEPLIVGALFNEAINLCLSGTGGNLATAREAFDAMVDRAWTVVIENNPQLRAQSSSEGGN